MQHLIFLFSIMISVAGYAQPQVYNQSLTDSTLPYLYTGVDNIIEIDWKGLKPASHKVSVSGGGGSISQISNNQYLVRAATVTDECLFSIIHKSGKTILRKHFIVKKSGFESASLSLGGLQNNSIATKETILSNPVLTFGCNDCFYKKAIQIISFTLSTEAGDNIIEATASGNRLTEKQIDMIRNTSTTIYFDNIYAKHPDGRTAKIPSLVIHIKKNESEENP